MKWCQILDRESSDIFVMFGCKFLLMWKKYIPKNAAITFKDSIEIGFIVSKQDSDLVRKALSSCPMQRGSFP